jgi:hypothetical protein
MKYYSLGDSYIVKSYFMDPSNTYRYTALSGNDNITFNGRPSDYMEGDVYYWKGKGKVNCVFTINRNKKQGTVSIYENQLGKYSINCPDTAYRSKGFTAYVGGITPDKKGKVYVYLATKNHASQNNLIGDSTIVTKDALQYYNEGAGFSLYATEIIQQSIKNDDIGVDGNCNYSTRFEKPIWLVK